MVRETLQFNAFKVHMSRLHCSLFNYGFLNLLSQSGSVLPCVCSYLCLRQIERRENALKVNLAAHRVCENN